MTTPEVALTTYKQKLANNRLGLWLFILSDSFVFAALLVTRFYLLGDKRPHLEQELGLIVTSVLLISSFLPIVQKFRFPREIAKAS